MRHVTVIVNPASRAGRTRRRRNSWDRAFRDASVQVDWRETTSREHAMELAQSAGSTDAVLAAGGDGTINAVMNGWFENQGSPPPFGVLYAGTSPDFCRFHGIPTHPRDAVRVVVNGFTRRVDVGRIEYAVDTDVSCRAYFGCSVNVGIGAQVAARANRWRPWVGDAGGTLAAVVSSLLGDHPPVLVAIDDAQPIRLTRCCNVCVAKNPFIASGLRIPASLGGGDGRLAVLGIFNRSAFGLLRLLPSLYNGHMASGQGLRLTYACAVHLSSDTVVGVEFDGDPHGRLPASIRVLPKALNLLVPHEHDEP